MAARQANMMVLRRCARCHEWLPLEQFAWKIKAKGRRQSYCFDCARNYQLEWYERNRRARQRQIRAYKAWLEAAGDGTPHPRKLTKQALAREFQARGRPVPDITQLTKIELIELLLHEHTS